MTTESSPSAPSLADHLSDWLNPILVKETRQALKSRQFVATFFLMLVASWLISVFGVVLTGSGIEYQETGCSFFHAYYVVLAIAVFVVVPAGAVRSMLAERELHTWEVLSITTLKPRQIVWGKLTSAIVQLFIYYSAITPFIAFANLLKGIDVPTIAFVLVASMAWSVGLTLIALSISTLGRHRYWQTFLRQAIFGGLLMAMFMSIMAVSTGIQSTFSLDDPEFWWRVAPFVTIVAAYCVLFLQIAVAQLTFDADNRSTGIRLAAAGIFWLVMAWFVAAFVLQGRWGMPSLPPTTHLHEMLIAFTTFAGIHWFVVGLFAATESDVLSRRVRRDLARFGVVRILLAPIIPGGSRGLLFLFLHLSALVAFVVGAAWYLRTPYMNIFFYAAGVWCYIVIYVGLGAALGRWARAVSGDFQPSHARVLTMLIVALGSVLPMTLYFFDSVRASPSSNALLFITNPFTTLYNLGESHVKSMTLLTALGIAAFVSVLVNVRAMLSGVVDVTRQYVPPPPAAERETHATVAG